MSKKNKSSEPTIFEQVLEDFLKSRDLPKSKAELQIWAEELNATVNQLRGSKGGRKSKRELSPEDATKMINKRWDNS